MSHAVLRRRSSEPSSGPWELTVSPPEDIETLTKEGDTFTFDSFTAADAWHLGTLLHTRLNPLSRPTLISIALASGLVVFQAPAGGTPSGGGFGTGVVPDNETWVRRKRASVLRWGRSTWYLKLKFGGDEARFARTYGMSTEQAGGYAIHGGGVPIYVRGVEGPVAVVVVSGLKQFEDHAVIVDTVKENWEAAH